MKNILYLVIMSIVVLNGTGQGKNRGQEIVHKLQGKWFFTGAPTAYTEIKGDLWTEHMPGLNAEITYKILYEQGEPAALEVIKIESPVPIAAYHPGAKIKMRIAELRKDLIRYVLSLPGEPDYCTIMVRDLNHPGQPSQPCQTT